MLSKVLVAVVVILIGACKYDKKADASVDKQNSPCQLNIRGNPEICGGS